MITITQSVGRGGRAKRGSDVLKVQELLNQAGAKPKLVPDSIIGPNTIRAIERYQSAFMKRPDGRIDPDGKSIGRLNRQAAESEPTNYYLSFAGITGSSKDPGHLNRILIGIFRFESSKLDLTILDPKAEQQIVREIAKGTIHPEAVLSGELVTSAGLKIQSLKVKMIGVKAVSYRPWGKEFHMLTLNFRDAKFERDINTPVWVTMIP